MLAACSKAPNVALQSSFWNNHAQKTYIAKDKSQPAALYKKGGQGILDVVISDTDTSTFSKYLRTRSTVWYSTLTQSIYNKLHGKGLKVVKYKTPINTANLPSSHQSDSEYAVKNFKPLATKIGNNKLLIVMVNVFGAQRSYYGFIPLGAPKGYCSLRGILVDTTNNKILWRYSTSAISKVQGSWDQPPKYPNFTAALNTAISTASNSLLDNLTQR